MTRGPGVSWNTGHGWTQWHRAIGPHAVHCGKLVPVAGRLSHTRAVTSDACVVCFPPQPAQHARDDRADVLDPLTASAGALV